jgi:protein-S-isoprenylcysteine O-methyltransferase Ste14
MKNAIKSTGLKLPPPIFYITALLLGLVLNYFFLITLLPEVWRYSVGIALIVVSGAIVPFVIIRYKKLKTPFDVRKPAEALITDGPNRYSRNPGYLSLTLLYLGVGFILNNIWILSLVVPVVLIMDLWIIRSEERHLEAVFGEQYLRYKSAVRRWI